MGKIRGVMRETPAFEEVEKKRAEEEAAAVPAGIPTMKTARVLYPFTAIVGQEAMKKALILNAINPEIGGVLIRGQKGTGKSIAVRGIAEILPPIEVVAGCRFSCDPREPASYCWECLEKYRSKRLKVTRRAIRVVDLPLNATEDRVVGTLDMGRALKEGVRAFEPGILAEANRGILYVDEINLLDDYVADVLLDAAAMGVNTVEREGISVSHPSRFIIVGSMNPEEGELRPQLLDRIALQAEVKGLRDEEQRVEIIKRVRGFNENPRKFREKYEPLQKKLADTIVRARALFANVKISEKYVRLIAKVCMAFDVDGHRADYIIDRTARTNAAYFGRGEVTVEDIVEAAELALPHRMRRQPLEEREFSADMLRDLVKRYD